MKKYNDYCIITIYCVIICMCVYIKFDSVQKKNKKAATKAALAKKIIKKKLKVNTKVLFDEEGQVMSGHQAWILNFHWQKTLVM